MRGRFLFSFRARGETLARFGLLLRANTKLRQLLRG
jgi:hypothetical protein